MPSANWSKFLFGFHPPLALHLPCTLFVKVLAEALGNKQLIHCLGSAGATALYWQPAAYSQGPIHVKVLYQGSDSKEREQHICVRGLICN